MGEFVALLDEVRGPADLAHLTVAQIGELCREIREVLVAVVARTGGHLGPNLGCVELTVALHRVFQSPRDRILFDTGHQAYVHKLLTGRRTEFSTLRQHGGLSGYPSRAESQHDVIENSHASTALAYADGIAKAHQLNGHHDRSVVAVIGDGALTGGMAWEALNNIGGAKDRPVVIVVNDNGRSYAPTTGGLAEHFAALRMSPAYEQALAAVKATVPRVPKLGAPVFEFLRRLKRGLKDLLTPQALFQDLGLKYLGPIDGHDVLAVEAALQKAKAFKAPVIVHCITTKGRGYAPAESHTEDCLHGPGPFDPGTGIALRKPNVTWTSVFAAEIVELGAQRQDIVAITAAMLHPTGLGAFAERFPSRVFDVGIAEQHAVTSAAGLALEGLHPVVALYATFLNRAFDQVLMDVALHKAPVTFVLDRAGITGDDGPSHNGMWDLSMLQVVPGIRVGVPRDAVRLRELLGESVATAAGPTVIRYPKGPVPADIPTVDRLGDMDVVAASVTADVLLVGIGPMVEVCVDVARRLGRRGVGCTVVDPRWVTPLDAALIEACRRHGSVAVVEDNSRTGGVGDAVTALLRDNHVSTPVSVFGIPRQFLDHGKRDRLLAELKLTAEDIERALIDRNDWGHHILPDPAGLSSRPA